MGTLLAMSTVVLICVVLTGAPQPHWCCWPTLRLVSRQEVKLYKNAREREK